jgi:opacity protein-like surface antigen
MTQRIPGFYLCVKYLDAKLYTKYLDVEVHALLGRGGGNQPMRTFEMNRIFSAFLVMGLVASASDLHAQARWGLEFRAGPAFPTQEVEGEKLGTGLGFGGTAAYRLLPHLWTYGGWDWHHFNPDESFAGDDLDLEETGYVMGVRFEHPVSGESGNGAALRLWAGATVNHMEIENQEGDLIADSGHGLGWEAGAGIIFPLTPRMSFSPGIRYRALSRDVEIETITTEVKLQYMVLELGVCWRF